MNHLYLIRHGRPASTWGDADEDPGLDDMGRVQARAVADRLLALPPETRPAFVVSSPLRRCRETARPLAEALGVEIVVDAAVGEIPTPRSLAAAERPAWLRRAFTGTWRDIDGDLAYEAWRRGVADTLLKYPGAAVFSHFVAINAVLSVLEGSDQVIVLRPDHTSVTTLAIEGGALRLVQRGGEAATGVL